MPKSMLAGKRPLPAHVAVYIFVTVPFVALMAAVPVAWGWGLTWRSTLSWPPRSTS